MINKSVYDVGYIGEGNYIPVVNRKNTIYYKYWHSMLRRCYSSKFHLNHPTYIGCTVCEEWHNFQVFAKWFDENYYECDGQKMELDKDILFKGNKVYSSDTCVFVPQRINYLFTKSNKTRGEYPIGVTLRDGKRFESNCRIMNNNKSKIHYLGCFNAPKEAFLTYKTFKENYIKQVADEYKDKIPNNLYKAMYDYKVEITD